MNDADKLLEDLKKARDEIMLKMHLASMELKDEWEDLEQQWQEFSSKAEMHKSAEGLGSALRNVGEELAVAFRRVRHALKD